MKAITVMQPTAQLLLLGAQSHELRRWHTSHRGPLLIHAGRGLDDAARALCRLDPVRGLLAKGGIKTPDDLPRGALLGTVNLENCLPLDEYLFRNPQAAGFTLCPPGRWVWVTSHPRLLPAPVPYQGFLGMFDVPEETVTPTVSTTPAVFIA